MAMNIVEKLLQAHWREGDYAPGGEIAVGIDQTLVHDATGTMAFLQFEALGVDAVRTERSVTYIDHNPQQIGFENSDDHLYLQSVSAKYGAKGEAVLLCNERSGATIECVCDLSARQIDVVLAGGLLNYITSA